MSDGHLKSVGRERVGGGATRVVALCGPYLSGKTSLLESILFAVGAVNRRGSVREGNTVGDGAPEARKRSMSTEPTVASFEYLGDSWTFIDCPGSIEFQRDAIAALSVCDAAVVVCEPQPDRAVAVAPLLKALEERHVPHLLFVNKMDAAHARVRDVLAALQSVSARKLLLRQVPIRRTNANREEEIVGYVDLVSERAYRYKSGSASDLIEMPAEVLPREGDARREMLEALADHDDTLLEQLIEDVAPEKSLIYRDLHDEFGADLIAPVLLGAGEQEAGVRRLLKALRHDTPFAPATAARRGLAIDGTAPCAECFKVVHQAHAGKLSMVRVWSGTLSEGQSLGGVRVGTLFRVFGQQLDKTSQARHGDIVAIAKMDALAAGQTLDQNGIRPTTDWPALEPSVYGFAVGLRNRADEVKLSTALHKLVEEDPSLEVQQRPDTNEMLLKGQGEMHLRVALDKLAGRYGLALDTAAPRVAYKETIRTGTQQHGRYKRQTGGHGQFGDVKIEIQPLKRGEGYRFVDKIVGGVVPRNYIPAVDAGAQEYFKQGPLGHPVVDVQVTLFDGSYHTVDSSEQAFKQATRLALVEGMAKCNPVLLEPILKVTFWVPSDATARIQRLISGRRGQILGFDAREGWTGWDEVQALMPEAEIADIIVEIRSATQGVGTFRTEFDHLQELTGKPAEKVAEEGKKRVAVGAH
jgi:elongation factor G